MRETESLSTREEVASEELADRLDTLSRPLAERVLGRAIEIQHEDDAEQRAAIDRITYQDLREIALEVGIPEDALRRALLEQLETERDPDATRVERLTTPKVIRGGTVVRGDRADIQRRIRRYLERIEGMRLEGETSDRSIWSQRHPGDRVMESITTDQDDEERHLLELNFDTRSGRKKARRLAIAAVVLGMIFGGVVGGLAIFGGMLVGIAAGVVGAVSWLRRLARKARAKVNGALAATLDDRERSTVKTWLDLWESQGPDR
jgi:hypothetical protein